jgi:cobalamin biosynthesis protein CobD/CbiB
MKIIIGARRSGKSTELIQRAVDEGGFIVTDSSQSAYRLVEMAKEMGIHLSLPVTYEEFLQERYRGLGVSLFHIDDIERFVQYVARGVTVATITLTLE